MGVRMFINGAQHRSQDGAAAVEFAIVVPVLLLILFGIVDLGRMLFLQVSLAAASHEGARASSLRQVTSSNASTVATAVATAVAQTAPGAARLGALTTASLSVASATYCTSGQQTTNITAQAPFRWVMPVGLILPYDTDGSLASAITLTASSEMLCAR